MPTAETTEKKNLVTVEIMGKKYQVPQGITLIQAMFHTGHQITRGIGCLGRRLRGLLDPLSDQGKL
ncbi:MAG: 2Fe-2S iron-sulfur cluster-binding protein [Candidatus Manganitrophus sp.]|nr:2Fe-2S iron-sulfur cluster-binding protein [Candidatus Manganitrophus sp.]